ncbi:MULTISPECIES: hypothetical protein [unclassified Streptomyces]|uniref:hypothetical protein n=1 Tax=unclassified Streptomyces TaxID=2593676 RepID=UPI0036BB9DDB
MSRATAHHLVRRWRDESDEGLHDRSNRPHATPRRTPPRSEARACRLRQERKLIRPLGELVRRRGRRTVVKQRNPWLSDRPLIVMRWINE